jgi:VWFA-related protein
MYRTLAFALIASASVQIAPTFHSNPSELVVLPVTVSDQRGQLVSGLPSERFVVFDNNHQQPIVFFSNDDVPVSVALVVDNSGSMGSRLGEVFAAALHFARTSHPEDELFVVEFNDRVRDALGGRPLSAGDAAELEAALQTLVPSGRTALYDGLMSGLERLESASLSRRVLVLISDGGDNASVANLDAVLARARRSNVTIYSLGIFAPDDRDANADVLQSLAGATGGERFLPRSPGLLMQACDRIAKEIRGSYTVGFAPVESDGNFHRVRVELTQGPKFKARTRPGYFAAAAKEPER